MTPSIALPILIPLFTGALSLAMFRWRLGQRVIAVLGTGALLVSSLALLSETWEHGYLVAYMGDWPAPFGISLVSDLLGAIMVVLTGITGFATVLFSLGTVRKRLEHYGYYPLLQLLLVGVNGAFLTGDIFNLYVWFEVMLVASFALLILGGERAQMEGAIKYVTLNLVSSAIFLSAVGLLYGLVGTLNMADIAQKIGSLEQGNIVGVIGVMFLITFAIKAAAFPFFFWLPASYHTPQVAVSALFAGLLTKVGVYAMYRMFTLVFGLEDDLIRNTLLWMAGLTMVTGVLGAAAQYQFRRILSFHIISQIGYMILGLALFAPLALVGGVFYIMHHIIVKSNLFLISGLVYRLKGSYELKHLGGLYRENPALSVLFLVPALSLAGLPPLSGFFAKFILIRAGVEEGAWVLVVVALIVGLLTLYSMIKVWTEVFWKGDPGTATPPSTDRQTESNLFPYIAIGAMALITVAIGFGAETIYVLAQDAADQLLNPEGYIHAVLGGNR